MMIARMCLMIVSVCLFVAPLALGKDKITYAMSQKVYKEMEIANTFLDQEKYQEAQQVLHEMLEENSKLSPYEKAQTHFMLGSIAYQSGETDRAISLFASVLDGVGKIPVILHMRALRTLAQLSLVEEKYTQAQQYAEQLLPLAEEPVVEDHALLAQIYFKLEDWPNATAMVEQARALIAAKQQVPRENLLLLQNAIYYEQKDYQQMLRVLDELVAWYPKSTYLLYQASIYGQLEQYDKQTVIMESLYEDGKLHQGSELTSLASLYMLEKVPFKAAVLLQSNIDKGILDKSERHYEMLAQAWALAAEEKNAANALGKAAKLSENGELYGRQAYQYFAMSDWQNTIKAIKKAFEKGIEEDDKKGELWLLMGMARFNLNAYDLALQACEKAVTFKKSRSLAEKWITFISREKDKVETMRAAINAPASAH